MKKRVLFFVIFAVSLSPLATAQKQQGDRGIIRGVVISALTGDPVVDAYVGVGEFGDSGGSNRSRHREMGWFAKTKTDQQGRFELDGLVFNEDDPYLRSHPLVVTHPEFVRHDEKIELPKDGLIPDVKVSLTPAAKIDVTIVDAQNKPLAGLWTIRLVSLDGRRFLASDRDPHMGSFASSIWLHQPNLRKDNRQDGFVFTELAKGEYSIEVMRLELVDDPKPAGIWKPLVQYYGGLASLDLKAGQTANIRIKPQNNNTTVEITLPEWSDELPKDRMTQIPSLVFLSTNLGLLLWDTDIVYGPEDSRLGRLTKSALFYTGTNSKVFTFKNLPPGEYAVFAGPFVAMNAAKVKVAKDTESKIRIPIIQTLKQSSVSVETFSRYIQLDKSTYTLNQLCDLLSTVTESKPQLTAAKDIGSQIITVAPGKVQIWDIVEMLYLQKGWRLDEKDERILITNPLGG